MYRIFFLLAFMLIRQSGQAQQDLQLNHYIFNRSYWNPAAIDPEWIKIGALYRVQWLGYSSSFDDVQGNPNAQFFSFTMPYKLKKNTIAGGINLANEQLGPLTNLELSLNFAYIIDLEIGTFGLGARGTYYNQRINTSLLRFVNPNDPFNRNETNLNASQQDFAFGVHFESEKLFGSISLNHVNQGRLSIDNVDISRLALHYYFMGGYNFFFSSMTLTPSVLVKLAAPSQLSVEGILMADFGKYYLGVNVRDGNAAGLLAGIYFLDQKLRLGYSFDYQFGNKLAEPLSSSSHEINIGYKIAAFQRETKYIIRTPRFRLEED